MQGRCDILDQWRPGVLPAMGLFMELGPCRVVGDDGEIRLKYYLQSWNEIILSVSGFHTRSTGSGFLVMLVSTNSICLDLTAYVSVEWIQLTLVPFVA